MAAIRLGVEGWRFIPHSYAIVNQYQCAELARRMDVRLCHRDLAYYRTDWAPQRGLLPPAVEQRSASLAACAAGAPLDAVYRISQPLHFEREQENQFVFATFENGGGLIDVLGWTSLEEAHRVSGATIITPSQWSKDGLIRCGAAAERIRVVPHGFDPTVFRPLPEPERAAIRRQFGLEGRFVFLSVGAMTENKGMKALLRAFAAIAPTHPQAVLLLKGSDGLFPSHELLSQAMVETGTTHLEDRLIYTGETRPLADVAGLLQIADCYLAPYRAEAFCMPVLEAAACGLPSIASGGGPTDEFTDPSFCLRIQGGAVDFPIADTGFMGRELNPDPSHLANLMARVVRDRGFRDGARQRGPAHVAGYTWEKVTDRLVAAIRETIGA